MNIRVNLRPYSSTIPSNPATLLDQRWIFSPNTHYHAFRKSTSQMAQAVKKPLQCSRHGRYQFHPWFNPWGHPWVGPWVRKMPWRRKWQPTPLFLPGESHEQRSLVVYGVANSWTRLNTWWIDYIEFCKRTCPSAIGYISQHPLQLDVTVWFNYVCAKLLQPYSVWEIGRKLMVVTSRLCL